MRLAFVPAFILCLSVSTISESAQPVVLGWRLHHTSANVLRSVSIRWENCLKQTPEWYRSAEAARIADNVLLYQREVGGWPKNIDMAATLTELDRIAIARQRVQRDATIDNGATYTQLVFLARVYGAQKLRPSREAFLKGLDYLLQAQYPNGGFPQYFPLRKGYYSHITFNDDAMIGVLALLRDIATKMAAYEFVDERRRNLAAQAVKRGVDCILKTQVRVEGRLTVWCAQHDEVTLAPAPARKFEPVSLSGHESVGIVRFLMGIAEPDERVRKAIDAAVAWFEKSKITNSRWSRKRDDTKLRGFDCVLVEDSNAGPIWARFYEIGPDSPIFAGRDSIIKYNVTEIEDERRTGYEWYVNTPEQLLKKDYPAWKTKWAH